MTFDSGTLNWILKAALWISANESLRDSFDALRESKNAIRNSETEALESGRRDRSFIYRLLESVV